MKVLAIIPARSGSKRIPNKNTENFLNRPLISYAIQAAKASGMVDRIIVSTDSPNIKRVAEKYGAEVVEVPMPNDIKDQYQKYTCADLTKLNKIIPHKDWCEWTVAEYIDNAL